MVARPGAPQSELRIGLVAASRDTPDYHALVTANTVLGGQFVSRVNLLLREQRGYTYGARTRGSTSGGCGGRSRCRPSVQTASTAAAIAASLDEIAAIRESRPISDDELALARGGAHARLGARLRDVGAGRPRHQPDRAATGFPTTTTPRSFHASRP